MIRRIANGIMAAVLLTVMLFPIASEAKTPQWNVKISQTDYYAELNNANEFFLCNKKSIGTKVGTEYYMTYTVESVQADKWEQNGIAGTANPQEVFPYVTTENGNGGIYKYNAQNKMMIEGRTYFLKFVITEDGYRYRAAWAKDDKSGYFELTQEVGEVKTNLGYFGLFCGDFGLKGKLTRIHCYDKYGNDLGVQVRKGAGVTIGKEVPYKKDTTIPHSYTVKVENGTCLALSNQKRPTGDKVYMQYKVASATSRLDQTGVILTTGPKAYLPYTQGYMEFDEYGAEGEKLGNGSLLDVGAEYLYVFEKAKDTLHVTVQKTKNGKVSYIMFETTYGWYPDYVDLADYYSLWFSALESELNFVLTDFKCYDSNSNNLGLQCNQYIEITHYGEWEDYSGCEAVYYCQEDESMYALYADQSVKYKHGEEEQEGTYKVEEDVLSITVNKETKEYDYLYRYFQDTEGRRYQRLYTYKIVFDTGEGSDVESQTLSPQNGYAVMKPNDPTKEGNTFVGWQTIDGKDYQFGQMETESLTLYAKWEKEAYVSHGAEGHIDFTPYIAVGLGALLLVICIVSGVILLKRGKTNEK